MEAHRAGVGGHLDEVGDGAVFLHAVGRIPEAEEDIGPDACCGQFAGDLIHRRGADAAAHHSDLSILSGQRRDVEPIAHRAGQLEGIAFFQRGQLVGALADDLIQKLDGLGLRLPLMDADGPGERKRVVRFW